MQSRVLQRKHESVDISDIDTSAFMTPAGDNAGDHSEKKHKKKHKKDKHRDESQTGVEVLEQSVDEVFHSLKSQCFSYANK